MPLHLQSIINDNQKAEFFAGIVSEGMDACDAVIFSEDEKQFHARCIIIDRLSDEIIGRIVYTIRIGEEFHEIMDLDIIWNNATPALVKFNTLKECSSDSNEYYEAETVETGRHFELETVNRYAISEDILGTEREVFISAFPFQLNVFHDINAFNEWAGLNREITIPGIGQRMCGFSDRFIMPGGLFDSKKKDDESYSFAVGEVVSFRDVEIAFGEKTYPFVLAQVDTALGIIPISMSRDVFDLKNLQVGCIVSMAADIKADLAKEEDWYGPKG